MVVRRVLLTRTRRGAVERHPFRASLRVVVACLPSHAACSRPTSTEAHRCLTTSGSLSPSSAAASLSVFDHHHLSAHTTCTPSPSST
ncbi:hypothetical protein BD311DRAFT_26519 [Dichomitus squalens]|uniref:Uncharacterized protein n=1 Tax=Dichomitus squalens TaxID=114155 RepID=A0A4Q9N0U6_9APHY|nr:hypothetical protein BD311DRAFT_26519 [Dichomitus squalens]